MSTPEELSTECLETLNELETQLSEAKDNALNATSEADSAADSANEARASADAADDNCINAQSELTELRTKLEELSAQLQSPKDSLAADIAKHKRDVTVRTKAGHSPSRIAAHLSISVVLVDLIIAQIEREAA